MATPSPAQKPMLEINTRKRPKNTRFLVIAPLILCGLCTAVIPFGPKGSLISGLFGTQTRNLGELTITAKPDGTLEVTEIPEYWFSPTAIGGALNYAMIKRFGEDAKPEEVSVIVKSEAGASDDAIRTAIADARSHGFVRFGFTDSHLEEVAQQAADAASMKQAPQRGRR